ncbi:potassium channel family protein [Hippea alviniae]|uniref:potassium channel family protein n=1 Tax=Hippea alviniae TaxID=1279027 RepID=UPI0003B2E572|nr:TrkA family potassium uptake protein [Hippea alviniae]
MSELFCVIGLGRFGKSVAQRLMELDKDVICIDKSEDVVKEVAELLPAVYQADCTDEKALKEIGIDNATTAIVSVGNNIETSVLSVAILHGFGIKSIYAKAINALHGRVLAKVGATKVIFPEKEKGIDLANHLAGIDIIEAIDSTGNYVLAKISAPKIFFDKSIVQLDVRKRFGLTIIAIERNNKIDINPSPNEVIQEGDMLLVVGSKSDVEKVGK